jgi:hypothetical protein
MTGTPRKTSPFMDKCIITACEPGCCLDSGSHIANHTAKVKMPPRRVTGFLRKTKLFWKAWRYGIGPPKPRKLSLQLKYPANYDEWLNHNFLWGLGQETFSRLRAATLYKSGSKIQQRPMGGIWSPWVKGGYQVRYYRAKYLAGDSISQQLRGIGSRFLIQRPAKPQDFEWVGSEESSTPYLVVSGRFIINRQ